MQHILKELSCFYCYGEFLKLTHFFLNCNNEVVFDHTEKQLDKSFPTPGTDMD